MKKLLDSGMLTLTMYTPETVYSRLIGHIDSLINKTTGLIPVKRFWHHFDNSSLLRFYSTSKISQDSNVWPVVEELFSFGPSLITVWVGERAIEKMLGVKGATHPAFANPDTIRGRFYCDSPLCNLMHSSDCESEFLRELGVLGGLQYIDETSNQMLILEPTENVSESINHSGIISLYEVTRRHLNTVYNYSFAKVLPPSDIAEACNTHYVAALKAISDVISERQLQELINSFLLGDKEKFDYASINLPANSWERLIINSGLSARESWIKRSGNP